MGEVDTLDAIREEADSDTLDLLEPMTMYALIELVEASRRLVDDIEWMELGASGPPGYFVDALSQFYGK